MYETVGHLEFVKSCRPETARISKDGKKYRPGSEATMVGCRNRATKSHDQPIISVDNQILDQKFENALTRKGQKQLSTMLTALNGTSCAP
jgi:hypothetical protein